MDSKEFFDYNEFDETTGVGIYTTKDSKQSYLFTADGKVYYWGTKSAKPVEVVGFDVDKRRASLKYETGVESVSAKVSADEDVEFLKATFAGRVELAKEEENMSFFELAEDVEETPIVNLAFGSYYDIELPPVKGSKDTIPARIVYAEHPSNPDDVSLYLIKSKSGFSGNNVDEYSDPQKLLEDYNATVINHIYYDKTGALKLKVYKKEDKVASHKIKGIDENKGLASWVNDKARYGAKSDKISKMKSLKSKVALGVVAGVVALGIAVGGPLTYYYGPDQSALANNKTKDKIEEQIKANEDLTFFLYDENGKPVRAGQQITNRESGVFSIGEGFVVNQEGLWGKGKQYETAQAFGEAVGNAAAEELAKNGIKFETFSDENGKFTTNFIYPVELGTADLNDPEKADKINQRDAFINYLKSSYGISAKDAEDIVKGYEEGFYKVAQREAEDAQIGADNSNDDNKQPEVKVDFQAAEVKASITNLIQSTGRNFEQDPINVFYASREEGKIFAIAGNYLYEIDLAEGEITSNEELAKKVEAGQIREAVKASVLFKNMSKDVLEAVEIRKAELNADEIYLANYQLSSDWTVNPTAIVVKDGGSTVEVDEMCKVSVKEGQEFDASVVEMNLFAFFGEDFTGKYVIKANEADLSSNVYSSNELTNNQTPVVEKTSEEEKTL